MQTVQHNRSDDYYRSTSSHDLPSQSQASHRHWWTSLATTPVYFTLDHSPYLNRYGMVNPVHWVCFLRCPPHTFHQRIYDRLFCSFLLPSPTSPLFFWPEMRQMGGIYTAKYILVWRWTDKGFSIDRLKYKLRFERSSPPIHGWDNSSRLLLRSSLETGSQRFPRLKRILLSLLLFVIFLRVHSFSIVDIFFFFSRERRLSFPPLGQVYFSSIHRSKAEFRESWTFLKSRFRSKRIYKCLRCKWISPIKFNSKPKNKDDP